MSVRRKKKGRPRQSGPREPNGRLQRTRDAGTDELQARRKYLADASQTTFPAGILYTNGAITSQEHQALCRLAWLWSVVHGKVSVAAISYEAGHGRSLARCPDDEPYNNWLAEREAELNRALEGLEAVSRGVREDVVALAVYQTVPRFMHPVIPTDEDHAHGKRVRKGLQALTNGSGRGVRPAEYVVASYLH